MLVYIYYVTIVFAYSTYVSGARVLGLFPHTGKSHQMVFEPLLRRLGEEGHHVTVASFFPLKNPPANYTNISFQGLALDPGIESIDLVWHESFGLINNIPVLGNIVRQVMEFNLLSVMALSICDTLVDLPILDAALKQEYDVVLTESFNSDCMLGLLHVYGVKAPIISLSSSVLVPWSADLAGVNHNPSYSPVMIAPFTPRMTFLERIENVGWTLYFKLWFRHTVQLKEQALIEKQFGRRIPDLADLARNISLMFVNTFYVLNGAMLLPPSLVEVGGMHLEQPRKMIPQVLAAAFHKESYESVKRFNAKRQPVL